MASLKVRAPVDGQEEVVELLVDVTDEQGANRVEADGERVGTLGRRQHSH